jgi:hypothetical protein
MAHRANNGKTIAGVRHVQIGDESVEAVGRDMSKGFRHIGGRDNLKPLVFKSYASCRQRVIVIHKEYLVGN